MPPTSRCRVPCTLRDLCVSCRSKTQCLVFSLSALALTQRTQRSSQRRRREYSARVQPSRLRRSQIFIALDRQRHLGGGLPPTSLLSRAPHASEEVGPSPCYKHPAPNGAENHIFRYADRAFYLRTKIGRKSPPKFSCQTSTNHRKDIRPTRSFEGHFAQIDTKYTKRTNRTN